MDMPLKFVWHRRGDSCKYLEVIARDRTKTPQLFTMYGIITRIAEQGSAALHIKFMYI